MIQDLDRTLEVLLRDRVPLRDEHIVFDAPDDAFRRRLSRTGLTANLYLYDVRENRELYKPEWTLERQPDGRTTKHRPKSRIDLFYLLTAWSPADPTDVLAEHGLLSRVLRMLLRYGTLPPDVLQGALIGQEPPLPTMVAHPNGMGSPGEFWAALHQPPRPAIHLMVTIGVDPAALAEEPLSLPPVVSRGIGMGMGGGSLFQLVVRPDLPAAVGLGAEVRRMAVGPGLLTRLGNPVFAARNVIRATQSQAAPLVSQEWYWIDDGMTKSELVRLGQVPAPATGVQPQEVEVAITPLLQFPHDPVTPPATPIPLRRATASDPDVIATSLGVSVNAGVSTLTVADLTGVSMNDVLLIADGEQTEGVLVTQVNAGVGAGEIGFRPPLRFAHRANLNLYRRTLDGNPAPPNRLVQPANLPGSPVTDATGLVAVNVLAMIGTGPDVEFAKVMPQGGQVLNVAPELRKNHPNQTLLWRVTAVEPPLGRLQVAAKAQSNEIALTGDPSAVSDARRRNRPFLAAGDVLVIGDPLHPSPIMVQIVSVNETPAGTGGPAEEFFAIGGWVTDSTNPVAHPVSGAQVTLTDLGLTARTDAEGRCTFANVPRGENYRLDVTADGFMPKLNLVKVPAPDAIGTAHGLNEYRVTLNT